MLNTQNRFTIFGKPKCDFCTKAKDLLDSKGISYVYHDISKDADAKSYIVSRGATEVPQVYEGSLHVGGFTELAGHISNE